MTNQELLKVYSAYLPYGVGFKCIDINSDEYEILTLKYIDVGFEEILVGCMEYDFTDLGQGELLICLRPLSDLKKEIEHNGEKFVPIEWLQDKFYTLTLDKQCEMIIEDERWINQCDYILIQYLLEWHFDIYGLIDQNLAINLNEVK